MSAPVSLRSDFDAVSLRKHAKGSHDPDQTRRLLALADYEIYDGSSRSDAARIGGVGLQIVRDWVLRFNAKGPNGLLTGKAPGAHPAFSMAANAKPCGKSWRTVRPPPSMVSSAGG